MTLRTDRTDRETSGAIDFDADGDRLRAGYHGHAALREILVAAGKVRLVRRVVDDSRLPTRGRR